MSESRILRSRVSRSIDVADRAVAPPPSGTDKFLGTVVAPGSGVSLLVDRFVSVYQTSIDGPEVEGGAVAFNPDTSVKIPGIVIGQAPVAGDRLVFSSISGRWIARKRGSGGTGTIGPVVPIPTCFCTETPATLAMTSFDEACNFGMFRSCAIRYQPVPSWAASLSIGTDAFLSDESFPDPIAGGALFYYYLSCHLNQYTLTRIYPTSPFGSPFRDAILYTWIIGATGNNCGSGGAGFTLDNGAAFPGSDLSCSVHIDGA